MSKLFEAIISKKIDHLNRDNILNDNQHGFTLARSTVIIHRISEVLDNKYISRTIALHISKAFEKVCYKGVTAQALHYGITGRVSSIIKSFLMGRSLKVVVCDQTSSDKTVYE